MSFEVIQSNTIYRGRAFDIQQDQVVLPDGRITQLDTVYHPAAVTLVPVDSSGMMWFIRQYRHPTRLTLLELPAGVMEAGEEPVETAQREIQEEIGMAAGKLQDLGGFFLAPGYSTEYMHMFLATELYPSNLPGDENEFLSVEKIPCLHAIRLAQTGEIQDAKSLVAIFWARPFLEQAGFLE
jgi:ADP-ribose pyrophosphatase